MSLGANLRAVLGDFRPLKGLEVPERLKAAILEAANHALAHRFDYLGSGLRELQPLDWHVDFKSGHRWPPGRFYRSYVTIDLETDADVKVPWELSRGHHLLWLGEAHLATGDEKYAHEIVWQVEDWIEQNPLMYSVNWTCAMEVGIRAVNWLYAFNMIADSDAITDRFARRVVRSLFEHAFFVYRNLEKAFPFSANHYAANIAALMFLGRFFAAHPRGRKWWDFARAEYANEVRAQVLPSGAHFERSISYHRLVTELFAYPYTLQLRAGVVVPADIRERLRRMFRFVEQYTKPSGFAPLVGDNDDGRLLPFAPGDHRDHRYLTGIGPALFGGETRHAAAGAVDRLFLFRGIDVSVSADPARDSDASRLVTHPDAGFVIVRERDLYLFFANSEPSRYWGDGSRLWGTHTHADLLSFELALGEQDVFIDPGTYVYTSSRRWRNHFRSTPAHNTLVVDGENQHVLSETDLFSMGIRAVPTVLESAVEGGEIRIAGAYRCARKDGSVLEHLRRVSCEPARRRLRVSDHVTCPGEHTFAQLYHMPADGVASTEGRTVVARIGGRTLRLTFDGALVQAVCESDQWSPSYGVLAPGTVIRAEGTFDSTLEIGCTIEWE